VGVVLGAVGGLRGAEGAASKCGWFRVPETVQPRLEAPVRTQCVLNAHSMRPQCALNAHSMQRPQANPNPTPTPAPRTCCLIIASAFSFSRSSWCRCRSRSCLAASCRRASACELSGGLLVGCRLRSIGRSGPGGLRLRLRLYITVMSGEHRLRLA